MPRDFPCVHRAADLGEAHLVVSWLAEQGIAAHVKDPHAVGMLHTWLMVAPQGVEVCVDRAHQAGAARTLLREHFAGAQRDRAHPGGTIEATCEECGRVSTFPAQQAGSVQDCPHCGRYMDVPEGEQE